MGNYSSKQLGKRVRDTDASSPIISKKQRNEQSEQCEGESPHLLPSSDSLEKIDVPSASGANSDPYASSISVIGNNYHIFLSFRGPDTRKGFVDHLYHRLKDVGLPFHPNFVFRDDEYLPFGEDIAANLLSAIERSKVSIPVISENYAASEWCLRELIHIMECKESRGQIVLPVLYKVKPKDVKHMLGNLGRPSNPEWTVLRRMSSNKGRKHLKALTLRVYESEKFASGHEGELVNSLVQIVLRSQQEDFKPRLARNLVGIEDRVAEVMKLVGIAHLDTRIIWIWGIGGIGKTTLATIIYNKLFEKFQYHSFLKDIRETISRKGIEHVQSQLISNTIKIHDYSVHDLDQGINMIQSSCTQKKVLFLLDDVDHEDHLNNLIGGCKFLPGSRIIVTCRQKSIKCLDKAMSESTYLYELQEMNYSPPSSSTSKTIHSGRVSQRERERAAMGNYSSKQLGKRVRDTDASSPIISKNQRHEQSEQCESESPLLLPSSDSLEKIDVPSVSGANSEPSSSSISLIGNNYHVFLSFRGLDTRKGFVDHLYHRLNDVGLRFHPNPVFRDDESLPFGEDIAANLLSAIKRSKVSIPVISENYAASEWCLRELIHIMECKESRGQIVFPVLYKVKPKDVKHMLGKFGEAFKSRMDRFKEDVKQQGPEALKKALTLRVYESEKFASGHEGELVNHLVQIVLHRQQEDFKPRLARNLVGIEDRVAEVMKLVGIGHPDTRIIWIWGMGGIGKTTLATIIYNKLFDKFQYRSFLKDIRETISRKGIEHVQSRLISNTIKIHDYSVHDLDEGINMIQSSCTQKKVLFLLDDVGHEDHLNNLIGGCKFSPGSRIIVTCRQKSFKCQDKTILESTYWYELQKMNIENSLLLFSIHAFEKKPPPKQLGTLSRDIVATTGGLPLACTVIGSHLKGKEDQRIWEDMLEKLRNTPDETVQQRLRISYDLLEHVEKQMFLDIACFFIRIDRRIATYLWDCKLDPRIRLEELINRSLIYVDDDNELRMHDELRDLGRAIACPADKELWDCSRLWDEDAMIVLRCKVTIRSTFVLFHVL
ncbi:probable WRKY transcription factor 19 [Eucalyptus grandis]|uniref:probable WRKY transcription factor 19 n=1 Tax=Eucalyptus grandis TaxID=71139 RepID=UPI00192E8384|nr:probable WRKY transcription factor 19 [Eucalyptus grandis]